MSGLSIKLSRNIDDYRLSMFGSPYAIRAIVDVLLLGLNNLEDDVFNSGLLGVMSLHEELIKSFTAIQEKFKEFVD